MYFFCITYYREQFHSTHGPWKYGYSRWNCVAKLYTGRHLESSGDLHNMKNSSAEILNLITHRYNGWNSTETLNTRWDMSIPCLWGAILDFKLCKWRVNWPIAQQSRQPTSTFLSQNLRIHFIRTSHSFSYLSWTFLVNGNFPPSPPSSKQALHYIM